MSSTQQQSVWLITGTSSGFGRRLVASVLARGDRVIATARSLSKIQDLLPPSSPATDNLRLLQLDVDDGPREIEHRIADALAFWGRIDVLVNNAGVGVKGIVEEAGSDGFRQQFRTNFFGAIDVTTAVLPHMRERRSGTIVIIGSRSAWKPELPGLGLYASSKAALHAFTESLSAELAHFSVRVLLVAPGAFRTESIYAGPWLPPHSDPNAVANSDATSMQTSYHLNEKPGENGKFKEPHAQAYARTRIPAWDAIRAHAESRARAIDGQQPGDPVKAMEVVVDVVRGEGVAAHRPWPSYLVLGDDAEADIRAKCTRVLANLDEWADVVRGVALEDQ